jgi:hypothetical protein
VYSEVEYSDAMSLIHAAVIWRPSTVAPSVATIFQSLVLLMFVVCLVKSRQINLGHGKQYAFEWVVSATSIPRNSDLAHIRIHPNLS